MDRWAIKSTDCAIWQHSRGRKLMVTRTPQEIWEAALGELQIQVSKPNYRTWFEKTTGLDYQNGQFVIGTPNAFICEYLDKNQHSLIQKVLIGLTSPDIKVALQVNGSHHPQSGAHSSEFKKPVSTQAQHPGFNSKYVFESFIEGSSNCLARAAALAVAQNPGQSYNPLFIYGGVGLGKTHLLHAIGHAAAAKHVQLICVSAEQFTNEFVHAIRERKSEEFRNKYRSAGMLLVDDIQFIRGKEQTEESFFHLFNELYNANRQIVITSDRPPQSMPQLEERLRSRFEWGLLVDIQPPDFETRLAILQAKAERREVSFNAEVLEFIARKIRRNIRVLEGSLNRVVAYARLLRASPTVELAAQALEDIASKAHGNSSITPALIIAAVADSFKLSPADLSGQKRDKETALARRLAMYLLRQETNCTLAQIGLELGGRDAAAVTTACKKTASDYDTSPYLQRTILDIQQTIHPRRKDRAS
ncbi:chromosomal replication initiator protein DnaA [Chloroflexota bacterium]